MAYVPSPEDLGTLWLNTSKSGATYYKGTLADVEVVAFPKTLASGKTVLNVKRSKPLEQTPPPAEEPSF